MAALAMTLGVAIVGGLVTGLLMRFLFKTVNREKYFDDEENWIGLDEEVMDGKVILS